MENCDISTREKKEPREESGTKTLKKIESKNTNFVLILSFTLKVEGKRGEKRRKTTIVLAFHLIVAATRNASLEFRMTCATEMNSIVCLQWDEFIRYSRKAPDANEFLCQQSLLLLRVVTRATHVPAIFFVIHLLQNVTTFSRRANRNRCRDIANATQTLVVCFE